MLIISCKGIATLDLDVHCYTTNNTTQCIHSSDLGKAASISQTHENHHHLPFSILVLNTAYTWNTSDNNGNKIGMWRMKGKAPLSHISVNSQCAMIDTLPMECIHEYKTTITISMNNPSDCSNWRSSPNTTPLLTSLEQLSMHIQYQLSICL